MLDAEALRELKAGAYAVSNIGGVEFHVSQSGAKAVTYPTRETAFLFSLTQLVNFIKKHITTDGDDQLEVNVQDFQTVEAWANELDMNEKIEVIAQTSFEKVFAPFPFEKQMGHEEFMINLLTKFEDTDARKEILKLVSSVRAEKMGSSDDDGISQVVKTKAGVHLTSESKVQNLWALKTFKTFPEVEQPEIPYILRLHQREDEMPKFALYECDGGKWKVDLTIKVREWLVNRLRSELADSADRVTVL